MDYLCKLVGTTQASCVFFSSFSILLIAVDRYLFIVHPTATQISTKQVAPNLNQFVSNFVLQAFLLSFVTLFISTFLSSPLFFLTKLDVKKTLMGETYSYCYEVKLTTSLNLNWKASSLCRAGILHIVGWSTPWSALSSSTWFPVWWWGLYTPSKYESIISRDSQIKCQSWRKVKINLQPILICQAVQLSLNR